jgi:hypothetical protein
MGSTGGHSVTATPVKNAGPTITGIGTIISKIHGALSDAIAPPRFVVDKRTIEKAWKLMDRGESHGSPPHTMILIIMW